FSSRRRHTISKRDWSSDVCSSDLKERMYMAFTTEPRPVVLFDLDGTLLPLDMKTFTEAYFKTLCGRFSQYNPQDVIQAVWAGTEIGRASCRESVGESEGQTLL